MIPTLHQEVAIALAMPLLLLATQAAHTLHHSYRTHVTAHCIRSIAAMVASQGVALDEEVAKLQQRYSRTTLLRSARFVVSHLYGPSIYPLQRIFEVCRVEQTERKSTIYATTASICAHPELAIRHIAGLERHLSLHEVAMLTQLLRRVGAPIAYTPLLTSENRNLRLIGVYLCVQLSIVDAESHILPLLGVADEELALLSLLTLCTLRCSLASPQVEACVAHLSPSLRESFIRHAVQSCYSLRSCSHLLNRRERRRFAQRIESYKSSILCN